MRLLKALLILLIMLALAFFLAKNFQAQVGLWLLPGVEFEAVHLAYILVVTLAAGILLGFVIGIVQIVSQQNDLRRQNRELKKLRTELNTLRHSALKEDIFEEEREPAEPKAEPETEVPDTEPPIKTA